MDDVWIIVLAYGMAILAIALWVLWKMRDRP